MEFVFKSEIEAFPIAVADFHHPEATNLGDMTRFKEWPDYAIDILVGGTPCQSFSIAGLRKGLADPRGNLTLTFLAVVERYRPRWVVWENVPGVHSSWSDVQAHAAAEESCKHIEEARSACREAGLDLGTTCGVGEFEEVDQSNDFDCFLSGLEELGYGIAARILDAQYCGVPQRRRRVFVVGHIGGQWQRAAAVLFERESLCGDPPPSRKTGKGFAHSTAPCIGASGRGFDSAGETRGQDPVVAIPIQEIGKRATKSENPNLHGTGAGIGEAGDPMFTLQREAQHGVCATLTKNYATHHGRSAGNNGGVAENQLIPFDTTQITSVENGCNPQHGDPCHPLAAGAHAPAIAFSAKDSGQDASDIAPTLRAGGADASHANSGNWVGLAVQEDNQNGVLISDTAGSLRADSPGSQPCGTLAMVSHSLRADGFDASEDGSSRGTPIVPVSPPLCANGKAAGSATQQDAENGMLIPVENGASRQQRPTVIAHGQGGAEHVSDGSPSLTCNHEAPILFEPQGTSPARAQENTAGAAVLPIAFTQNQAVDVLTGDRMPAMGTNQNATGRNTPKVQLNMAVRRLTPRECERLQGFPDDYTRVMIRGKPAADGPRYKALGNSMAVPVMRWIGERILKVEELVAPNEA
jgi:DNA (cytosine-5)-methyltransferase 1